MMSEWISVKDKLPAKDDYNDYLITGRYRRRNKGMGIKF